MNKTIYFFLGGAVILSLVFFLAFREKEESVKTAYINNIQLYENFELTQELEGRLEGTLKQHQYLMDSLKVQLESLQRELSNQEEPDRKLAMQFEMLRRNYELKYQKFEEEEQQLMQQYNEQIWTQINQYVQAYGRKNNYDYIYGTSGEGTLMYASDKREITKEVSNFINSKYNGK
jgi:outer membrane protein